LVSRAVEGRVAADRRPLMFGIPLGPLGALKSTIGIIAAIVVFGAGVTTAELNERKMPWGLGHRLEKLQNSVAAQVTAAQRQGHTEQLAYDVNIVNTSWRPALAQCQSEKLATSQDEAGYLDEIRAAGSASRDAAYRLGAASCRGGKNASTRTGQRGGTTAVGLRNDDVDLRDTLAGAAYRAPTH
jgi:hypothetical protein